MTHHRWPSSQAYIDAEIVTYGETTPTATGLGAYIAQATETGNFDQILSSVAVISLYIVGLHRLAEQRYFFT